MEKKVLFFDIDGTLMDHQNRVPESARLALQEAGERGHIRLLCTGRTVSMLPPAVAALGFDGIVGGAGTSIQIHDKTIFNRELTLEEVKESLKWLTAEHFGFLYEGNGCVHVMPWEHYAEPERYQKHIAHIGAPYEVIDIAHPEQIHTSKFSASIGPAQWEYGKQMIEGLSHLFHAVVHQAPAVQGSSRSLAEGLVEFLPLGFDKAAGIRKTMEYLGMDLDDAYAFGDSNNDLEMLHLVPHSICMGNGTEAARQAAEYITSDINQDGIRNAMLHYGLIG